MTTPSHRRQAGVTLLEVLIAIVILSLGLLGLAGMLASSLKNNNTAYYRSQATILADDMLDRMRANLPIDVTARSTLGTTYMSTVGNSGTCSGSGLAYQECAEWKQKIAATLPGGLGGVSRTGGVGDLNLVTITICWNEGGSAAFNPCPSHTELTMFQTTSRL